MSLSIFHTEWYKAYTTKAPKANDSFYIKANKSTEIFRDYC